MYRKYLVMSVSYTPDVVARANHKQAIKKFWFRTNAMAFFRHKVEHEQDPNIEWVVLEQ